MSPRGQAGKGESGEIGSVTFRTVVEPMRTTFATALGSKNAATSVLVRVALRDSSVGLGEVPTSFVMPHETPAAIAAVLRRARRELVGADIAEYPMHLALIAQRHAAFRMTLSGLEVAMFRAKLAHEGRGELEFWREARGNGAPAPRARGRRVRAHSVIETDITVPFLPRETQIGPWLDAAIARGFATYKVKIGGDVSADAAFVAAVHRRLADAMDAPAIRLDGNQGYRVAGALRLLEQLDRAGVPVEMFEQPLHKDDFAGLKSLRARSPVPIILDETVFDAGACRRVAEERLGDGVNIKIAKSGIEESIRIMRAARRGGLSLMVGCMTETMVGLSAGILMAAGTGAFDYVDLDSVHFLRSWEGLGRTQPPRRGAGAAANVRACGPRYFVTESVC